MEKEQHKAHTVFASLDEVAAEEIKKRLSAKGGAGQFINVLTGEYRFPVWDRGLFYFSALFFIASFGLYALIFTTLGIDWAEFFWGILFIMAFSFLLVWGLLSIFPPLGRVSFDAGLIIVNLQVFGRSKISSSMPLLAVGELILDEWRGRFVLLSIRSCASKNGVGIFSIELFIDESVSGVIMDALALDIWERQKKISKE